MPIIVWFRQDLRISDNPALAAAIERKEAIVPLYVYSPEEEGAWTPGGATKWWLHHSLTALDQELRDLGSQLIIRCGATLQVLEKIIRETEASAVFWNRRYEPEIRARDTKIKASLVELSVDCQSFNGTLLVEPWEGCKDDKTPYLVYTPFQKNISKNGYGRKILPPVKPFVPLSKIPSSLEISELKLLPTLPWANDFKKWWSPGSAGACSNLNRFLETVAADYDAGRNLPAKEGTSRLSPHLHFGEISPNQIVAAIRAKFSAGKTPGSIETYVKEIVWREFAYHLLYHFPETPHEPLRKQFNNFPWSKNKKLLSQWQKGMTGYPIVDAGMRELWRSGWMHNRVRMIAASFLVKDLLIPWQDGVRWFWDTLVDADLASNTLGWQWTAGCGADAAPYFRVFNPVLQGEKFDPSATYVRQWVPELAALPNKWIHKPWEAPASVLTQAGIVLGRDYPKPIVDHSEARNRALEAYHELRENAAAKD